MKISYDLDGVLAEAPKIEHKKYGLMNGKERNQYHIQLAKHYLKAKKLYDPKEQEFYVISARRLDRTIYSITKDWLTERFGNRVLGLYLLNKSRTYENVINFKCEMIKRVGINKHYEDDPNILKGIRKNLPAVELFLINKEMSEPIKFE